MDRSASTRVAGSDATLPSSRCRTTRRWSRNERRGRLTLLASDGGGPPPPAPLWRGLTESPETILDVAATRTAADAAAVAAEDRADIRRGVVAVLRQAHAEGRAAIATSIAAAPRDAHRAIHDYAWLLDQIVTLSLDLAHRWLHPLASPTASERI